MLSKLFMTSLIDNKEDKIRDYLYGLTCFTLTNKEITREKLKNKIYKLKRKLKMEYH
jgi:hypothetical protein